MTLASLVGNDVGRNKSSFLLFSYHIYPPFPSFRVFPLEHFHKGVKLVLAKRCTSCRFFSPLSMSFSSPNFSFFLVLCTSPSEDMILSPTTIQHSTILLYNVDSPFLSSQKLAHLSGLRALLLFTGCVFNFGELQVTRKGVDLKLEVLNNPQALMPSSSF